MKLQFDANIGFEIVNNVSNRVNVRYTISQHEDENIDWCAAGVFQNNKHIITTNSYNMGTMNWKKVYDILQLTFTESMITAFCQSKSISCSTITRTFPTESQINAIHPSNTFPTFESYNGKHGFGIHNTLFPTAEVS